MKKEELVQLVRDLTEMNKYLVKENEELKNELKRRRDVFLETIEKWEDSVERLTKKSFIRHSFFIYKSHTQYPNECCPFEKEFLHLKCLSGIPV